ncbi:RDD family protein [Phragmitibacter flavus]|uniref:RDD family protein n=1 Tax=Phragmitibacter flavus TaxID=2576071 RepID=A0A5R8KH99_9BACT|nr:RDD family protein [Phragmitibacter flavus]TLD71637.1 RDD family protein [Phragmitibacter flavus]
MQYHLNIAGEPGGPHSQFTIIDRIRDGSVTPDMMIWRQGFDAWRRVGDVEEFEGYWKVAKGEEDTPTRAEKGRLARAKSLERAEPKAVKSAPMEIDGLDSDFVEMQKPRPWLRFWARMVDYMWFTGVVVFILAAILPVSSVQWMMWASQHYIPIESLLILCYVPVEAWCLARFGKTPGRALLRLEVVSVTGGRLTFQQALVRSVQVYVKGVGLWLPLVSLLVMSWSRVQLLRRGQTSWDVDCGTAVTSEPPQRWRLVLLGAMVLGLAVLTAMGFILRPELVEAMKAQGGL